MRRRFEGVDVEVVGERILEVEFQHGSERRDNFLGAGLRLALGRPLIPRTQAHHGLGEKNTDIRIQRELFPDLAHCVGVALVEGSAVGRLGIGVALAQRVDQCALDWRSIFMGSLLREAEFLPSQFGCGWRHHREIDVRAVGQRDAPRRHGEIRGEVRGLLERPDGRAVIETEEKAQTLIKIFLGLLRLGGDLVGGTAEAVV